MTSAAAAARLAHDPPSVLARLREHPAHRPGELWLFGYASLIWRPELPFEAQHPARVVGWHRALRMRSTVNRGTPQVPGLVFALLPGGACRGVVYRLKGADEPLALLEQLWLREMPNDVYDPRWLSVQTDAGVVPALGFTLNRRSPSWTGALRDEQMLQVLRTATGRFGRTVDYLQETAVALRAHGIHDAEVERLMALAEGDGLLQPQGAAAG